MSVYGLGGHYTWHTDVGPGEYSKRKLSITVQISNPADYLGGTLQFHRGHSIDRADRRRGSCTIFPSFLLHRVKPVFFGTRIALVGWARANTGLR